MTKPQIFLASPAGYDVVYTLNDLTDKTVPVSRTRALEQWERLRARLEAEGADVRVVMPPTTAVADTLPDLVFVSNAALLVRNGTQNIAIMARPVHTERQGEVAIVAARLAELGWQIRWLPTDVRFEGVGDCRWSHGGRCLWIGYGAGRTSLEGIAAVRTMLTSIGRADITVRPLRLVSGQAYHLDLALCVFGVTGDRALWSPWAFSPAARKTLRRAFGDRLISVPRTSWACNSFAMGNTLFVPRDGYRSWLRERTGCRIVEVNVSEFQKAGGSVSCMVLAAGT